jgi:hypothetical protein
MGSALRSSADPWSEAAIRAKMVAPGGLSGSPLYGAFVFGDQLPFVM